MAARSDALETDPHVRFTAGCRLHSEDPLYAAGGVITWCHWRQAVIGGAICVAAAGVNLGPTVGGSSGQP